MSTLMTNPVLNSLRREVDRLFDRVWEGNPPASVLGNWNIPADVSETVDAVTVQVELPGMRLEDIRLTLKDQALLVRGDKRREIERKDASFFMVERCYGAVARTIQLPAAVDPAKVNATFKNGVLTVAMEKASEARGTTINIKVS